MWSPALAGSAIYRAADMVNLMLESVLVYNGDRPARRTGHAAGALTLSPGIRGGWNLKGEKQIVIGAAVPVTWTDGDRPSGVFGYFSYELPFTKWAAGSSGVGREDVGVSQTRTVWISTPSSRPLSKINFAIRSTVGIALEQIHRLAKRAERRHERIVLTQDHLVIELAIDPPFDHALDVAEVDDHIALVEAIRPDLDLHGGVVPVRVFAHAVVIEQPVTVTEVDAFGNEIHKSGCGIRDAGPGSGVRNVENLEPEPRTRT